MGVKFAKRIENLVPSGIRRVNERALALEREGKKVCHFELGRPDFDTPEYIKKAGIKAIEDGDVFYTSNFGKLNLREAVAKYLSEKKHIPVAGENILITVGLAEAIFDVLAVLLEEGDEILVPDPVWMNYVNIPKLLGAKPIKYDLSEDNDYQPDMSAFEERLTDRTKAVVIVSPHNPTGSMLSADTLKRIADIAKKHDLTVISDEIYERLTYGENGHISIASLPDMAERTVTLNGFSKAYSMTGWRIGYVAASKEWISALNKIHQVNTTSAASFTQTAAIEALCGENDEVERMREEYRIRRDDAVKSINQIKGLSCKVPEGAFYIFINVKALPVSEEKFAEYLLENYQVAMVPGTVFCENGRGYLRMSFASGIEELKEGLSKLERAAEKIFVDK